MPTKIRLQRHGKKAAPYYHIVIADGRAPRDGRFIEKIGTYNPLTIPADIQIDIDRAVYWYMTGAQPTETVKAILSYKGILYKVHLLKGVKKGALTEEQANAKFIEWQQEKEAKITSKIREKEQEHRNEQKKRLETEIKVNDTKAAQLAKKRAAALDAEKAAEMEQEAPAEEINEAPVEIDDTVTEETTPEVNSEADEAAPEEPKQEEQAQE